MSEHSEISKEAEADYDTLLDRMLTLVELWMDEEDGFLPCGAAISTDGEVTGRMVDVDDDSTAESMMHMLFTGLQADAKAGTIRASCLCYDGGFEDDDEFIPAIVVILEHIRGPATICYRPYQKTAEGTYDYAEMEAEEVEPEIFAAP